MPSYYLRALNKGKVSLLSTFTNSNWGVRIRGVLCGLALTVSPVHCVCGKMDICDFHLTLCLQVIFYLLNFRVNMSKTRHAMYYNVTLRRVSCLRKGINITYFCARACVHVWLWADEWV
jgi:hypothetical protein